MDTRVDREAQLAALHQRLADEVRQLRTGEEWARWLAVAARFPTYSFNNTLLILAQHPQASNVAGYRAWQSLGRQVDKGQKGLQILAPILRKAAVDEESADAKPPRPRVAGYRVTHVWDLSQTSGKALPEQASMDLLRGQAPDGLWTDLAAIVAAQGFSLERGPCHGANGVTDFTARTVRVRDDVDDAQAVKTLAHELGHVLLHDFNAQAGTSAVDCRGVVEVEAESVAYLVTASHGLASDTYTFPYVTTWASRVPGTSPEDVVSGVGKRVTAAARQILAHTSLDEPVQQMTQLAARAEQVSARTTAVLESAKLTERRTTSQLSDVPPERLLDVHADAAEFYAQRVGGSWVPDYLEQRGLEPALEPNSAWQIGYAPAGWTTLVDHLREAGYTDETLEASGLATRARTGQLVDRFRDRLTLPIHDDLDRVIAFVGRAHPDAGDRMPKYLNSPTTAIYRKGEHLLAASGIGSASGRTPVVVEGPLDAVAVSIASPDMHTALALCGTALTASQALRLSELAGGHGSPVIVATDADVAGRASACASYRLLSSVGLVAWAADLPPGLDPAALLETRGGALRLWSGLGQSAYPLIDLVVDTHVAQWADRLQWVEGMVGVVRELAPDLAMLGALQLGRQTHRLADLVGVEPRTVQLEVSQVQRPVPPDPRTSTTSGRTADVVRPSTGVTTAATCPQTGSTRVARSPQSRGR